MALGDILSVVIDGEGFSAYVTVEGFSTGAVYDFGFNTTNDPTATTPKMVFTVTSMGFDDTGAFTPVVRTVYGTKLMRLPWPNQASMDEVAGGGNMTFRVALSDYIYAKDALAFSGADVTVDVAAGTVTSGGTPNNIATGFAVTNGSTIAYPRVVGNWSWPNFRKVTGRDALRGVFFHKHGQQGRPVRMAKFIITDGIDTEEVPVTTPTIDGGFGDACPVIEYVGLIDTLWPSFTPPPKLVTVNFKVYPWIGDDASVLDTTDAGATAQPTANYGPQTLIWDTYNDYCESVAVVDAVNGNDATGTVTTNYLTALPFLTLKGARDALKTYNNTNYSRNNAGGSTIYLKAGNYAWCGGTVAAGATTAETWLTITAYPGVAKEDAIISSQSGSKSLCNMTKLEGITCAAQSATGTFDGISYLWVHRCVITSPVANNPMFYRNPICYATQNVSRQFQLGFTEYATTNCAWAIVRGNDLSTISALGASNGWVFIGNLKLSNTVGRLWYTGSFSLTSANANMVCAFNRWTGAQNGSSAVAIANAVMTHGMAFVQNVVEDTIAANPTPLAQFWADSSTATPADNLISWHNTFIGARYNGPYNEVNNTVAYRRLWSLKNNYYDDCNLKTDTFPGTSTATNQTLIPAGGPGTIVMSLKAGGTIAVHAGCTVVFGGKTGTFLADVTLTTSYQNVSISFSQAFSQINAGATSAIDLGSTNRVGNWSTLYGCGCSGECIANITGMGAGGAFPRELPGMSSYQKAMPSNPTAWALFCIRGSCTHGPEANGIGNGDYHPQPTSPLIDQGIDWVLPYDLNGKARVTGRQTAGAYQLQTTYSSTDSE